MISASKTYELIGKILSKYFFILLLLMVVGCASPLEREVRLSPEGPHDQVADRAACLDYAKVYGVINLGPMMGETAQNQPDRQRRNLLFVICMEEKGYRF
jgi:hypothetical protein